MNKIIGTSISTKLKFMIVSITFVTLFIASTIIVIIEYKNLESELIANAELNANVIGQYTVNPLLFEDKLGCDDILEKASVINNIVDITIYDTTGTVFSTYSSGRMLKPEQEYKTPVLDKKIYKINGILNIIETIKYEGDKYGFIHLRATYSEINEKIKNYIWAVTAILLFVIIFTFILASSFQKIISKPILNLAKISNEISITGNYNHNLEITSKDELGILYREFRNMITEIKQRTFEKDQKEQQILKLNEELEGKVQQRTLELRNAQERTQELLTISNDLLLNILPESIATRLKQGEKKIADFYEDATVVFIDIVDFTKKAAISDPNEVVDLLNTLYTKLDNLAHKHGLEKIKTIGDCYMAAAGVPVRNANNAAMAANFAVDAMNEIGNYPTSDGTNIQFRCGIDGGPVIAGIIGEKKFIYDLWGATVNTAARMEKSGLAGKIQCSDKFKEKVEKISNENFNFIERGEINIKGIGKMQTYYLDKNP
ncbi:MAG: hypothetical protein A2X64_09385 [Ignavibacteria bacterium GWF2_33_9]|nr:MAG: hypothetical protein A2X64_09385 [Ignavibacteria bacterium GWF2_33_9]